MTDIRPLHVGKFIPPPFAGVEAHIDTLLSALAPDILCTLVAADSPIKGMSASIQNLPYKTLIAHSFGKFASATLSPGVINLALKNLRVGESNLLHLHAPNPWGDILSILVDKNIPVVMTWHSDIIRQKNLLKIYKYLQRSALKRVDKIILPTPFHATSSTQLLLEGANLSDKFQVIPMGINFDEFDATAKSNKLLPKINEFAKDRIVVLTVGRHVGYKGYEYLLEAFSLLDNEAVLVMIGTGPLSDILKKRAQELNILKKVFFAGSVPRNELVSAFKRCDIFTLPSIEKSEAFGIASAEAMYCGKPTVVCDLGNGVNYLNQDGVTSIFSRPRDSRQLANSLDLVIKDSALRAEMGCASNKWIVENFSILKMKSEMIALYKKLI